MLIVSRLRNDHVCLIVAQNQELKLEIPEKSIPILGKDGHGVTIINMLF